MLQKLRESFNTGSEAEKNELKKLAFLSGCFFLSIAAFSIIKPLKQTIFAEIVGVEYQPLTRFVTLLLLAPVTLFYSRLVDKLRRYKLVSMSMFCYAIGSLVFAYFLWHPVYGLSNTLRSSSRLLGWAIYVFGDFYQIFVVSAFWAFANSITTTESAKKNYGIMVAVSKVAGMTSPFLAKLFLQSSLISKDMAIPMLVGSTSVMLLGASSMIYMIKKSVPGQYLHGYEAVYKIEKKQSKVETKATPWQSIKKMFDGIRLMIEQPYVFGIFGLVYSYEIISAIMDYQMQVLVKHNYPDVVASSEFMLNYTSAFQGLGLLFAVFGTRSLLTKLDVKTCLLITPICVLGLLMGVMYSPSLFLVTGFMIILRALNYGFNVPVKEILYIPTIKDIKFKSKAWIDSFGKSLSKASGSTFNIMGAGGSLYAQIASGSMFAIGVTGIWCFIALFVGNKYAKTVESGSAIGDPKETSS